MRVTGGFLRGRVIESPQGGAIRPTADKTRLAIFNMLESRGALRDQVVLDAFCGTGALGIEAISRGAAGAIFMDNARASLDLARRNAHMLGVEAGSHFLEADATHPVVRPGHIPPAHLIFLDPPYNKELIPISCAALDQAGWIHPAGAFWVMETEKEWNPIFPPHITIIGQKTYGQSAVYLGQTAQSI